MDLIRWQQVHQAYFHCITRQTGALCNILDALVASPEAGAAVELTLSPWFARRWPSFYQGLQEGRIRARALRQACAQWLPGRTLPRLVLALDATSFLRPASSTARDRTLVHVPNLPARVTPVGPGWQCSALAVLPDTPSSWTYYLSVTRVPSWLTPTTLGALQLSSVLPLLPQRPLTVADRLYGSVEFVRRVSTLASDFLIRLQAHRVFYRQPPAREPGQRGGRRKYGAKFKCNDPRTHGPPTAEWIGHDATGRRVRVRMWDGLAFHELMTQPLAIIQITCLEATGGKRDPQEVWLLWISPDPAPLAEVTDLYRRRFSIDHGFRFDKQCLLWDGPRLRTPGQFQRWTDLVVMAHNLIVSARDLVPGHRRPWESPQRPATPQQVRRALAALLAQAGTLAPAPVPRGKSPGRRPGTPVPPAKRHPVIRKSPAPATRGAPARELVAA
jgi:hypothetical protein